MEIRLLSKLEQKIELTITLFQSIFEDNNWHYYLQNTISYSDYSPNGECMFSIWTNSLMEKSILVGTIRNIQYPNDILFDTNYSFCHATFELCYQDENDILSDVGIKFTYQFLKAFLRKKQDWIFEDLENWRTYNLENIEEFATKYKISLDSTDFNFN
jgi:hypothetical protein